MADLVVDALTGRAAAIRESARRLRSIATQLTMVEEIDRALSAVDQVERWLSPHDIARRHSVLRAADALLDLTKARIDELAHHLSTRGPDVVFIPST